MNALDGFDEIGDVVADDRGRIAIGKVVSPGNRFLLYKNDDTGELLLVPHVLIPSKEFERLRDVDRHLNGGH